MQNKNNYTVIPDHIAIIMDGNGRWAKKRLLPRVMGHINGVNRVRDIVRHGAQLGVKYLTLFTFGRENWKRPQKEVSFLMRLLSKNLDKEFINLHQENIKITFIGDRTRIDDALQNKILNIETLTQNNTALNLIIALDYSGRHDIVDAINKIIQSNIKTLITEDIFSNFLSSNSAPFPDLLIRTSGEHRISNFLLWQIAYTELYFTDTLWPDFTPQELDKAITWFGTRERRFGKTSEQMISQNSLSEG